MTEFVENDVLAEIGNEKDLLWIVQEVGDNGYFMDSFFDGRRQVCGVWQSFRTVHNNMVKVDEWDDWKMVMKNVEEV